MFVLVALLAAAAAPAAAQQRLFPNVPSFEPPLASPRAYGLVARLLSLSRGESRFGAELEGEVALGEELPLLSFGAGHPVVIGFGGQVYGRFSLDDSKSALISNDWVVGLTGSADLGRWGMALQLYHESSHLGDEYRDEFGVGRLDWTREVARGWLSYRTGGWRAMVAGSWVLADELRLDRPGAAVGLDYRGPVWRALGAGAHPIGGVFVEGAGATAWRLSTSARLGVAWTGARAGRGLSLALIAHDGLSTQRQFYREPSRYVGVEIKFDL